MLFFTSGRVPTLRRSRRDPSSWLSGAPSVAPESAMKDAGAALRRVGEDIAGAARQIGAEATRQARANTAAASADAKRQVRRNVKALRANASAVPDDLLPAGRDAIRKSLDTLVPGRRKRARRGLLFRALAVLAVTGLALLGVQMLMMRRSGRSMRRKDWARSPEGPLTGQTVVADSLGISSSFTETGSAGQRPPVDLLPDAATEPATFDRDAGIRAATEGMQPEPHVPGSWRSEIPDGT